MNWFLNTLQNHYSDVTGRARRKEFWMFVLFTFLISLVLGFLDALLGTTFGRPGHERGIFEVIFSLAILVPSIAVSVRRMHDLGHSGWWVLLSLIPIVNLGVLIYMCFPGTPGINKYGPNPKEMADLPV